MSIYSYKMFPNCDYLSIYLYKMFPKCDNLSIYLYKMFPKGNYPFLPDKTMFSFIDHLSSLVL